MEYEFKNKVSVFDFFGMAMANTYKLPLGLVNVIFTVSLIALSLKFWNQAGDVLQVFMLLGCLIFPVFQPFFIFGITVTQYRKKLTSASAFNLERQPSLLLLLFRYIFV